MVTAERGSLLQRLCLWADIGVARRGFNPFPVSHSFVLGFFPLLHKLHSGSSLCHRRICEIPALQPWLWDVLAVHSLLLGSCHGAALAGVLSSWLGWDELFDSCPPPRALYLAWVLSCSGAVWAGGFPSADLFLNSLHVCSEGFSSCLCCVTFRGSSPAAWLQLLGCFKLTCHLSVWRKGQGPYLGVSMAAWSLLLSSLDGCPQLPVNPGVQILTLLLSNPFAAAAAEWCPVLSCLGHCTPQCSLRRMVSKARQGFETHIELLELLWPPVPSVQQCHLTCKREQSCFCLTVFYDTIGQLLAIP